MREFLAFEMCEKHIVLNWKRALDILSLFIQIQITDKLLSYVLICLRIVESWWGFVGKFHIT